MYDLIEIMTTYQHESESDLSPARFITISALSLKSTGADEKGVEKGREEKEASKRTREWESKIQHGKSSQHEFSS